ncbi:MAG: McrC family protein [Saprospiraceae bacterium]
MPVITTFEHCTLKLERNLSEPQLNALQAFHGNGSDAFSLVHRGIRTGSFVGVIQVGNLTLEILPKADKVNGETFWRSRLVEMLRVVTKLPLQAPSESKLALRPGAVLHLYFELFVREMEQLVRRGLVRQYHRKRRNSTALKGRLVMSEHLRQNLVHKERFAVEHDVYDRDHTIHQILFKALQIIGQLDHNNVLRSRLSGLELDFPEQSNVAISPALFERLSPKLTTRKFAPYTRAMHIAQLLLLNHHPDLKGGRQQVLALVFNMNNLWESFVAAALRRHLGDDFTVRTQTSTLFWKSEKGTKLTLRPDVIVEREGFRLALDTKWKVLGEKAKPSISDLRQLYSYSHYFDCQAAALVYPGQFARVKGTFEATKINESYRDGSLLALPITEGNVTEWMQDIAAKVKGLMPEEELG